MYERLVLKSPVSVMVRGPREHTLAPTRLDELFERTAETQYTREPLFSTTVDLMSEVVCGVPKSVHPAYEASADEIAVSGLHRAIGEPGAGAGDGRAVATRAPRAQGISDAAAAT